MQNFVTKPRGKSTTSIRTNLEQKTRRLFILRAIACLAPRFAPRIGNACIKVKNDYVDLLNYNDSN